MPSDNLSWVAAKYIGPSAEPLLEQGLGELDEKLLSTSILIVEDEAMIAWVLESLLNDMGSTTVALAPTAQDAIAAAQTAHPGLIVSDINLGSGPDGIDAAAAIVSSSAVPIIFVSGYASDEMRSRIDRHLPGALVLRKPVQEAELRQAVISLLGNPTAH